MVTNTQGPVTSNAATVTVQPAGAALVTAKTLGTTRNNYTGWVGMKILIGTSPMTVSALGRIVGPGNTASHTVKIVDATSNVDVPGATALVLTAGGATGSFAYSSLASPVTLSANTSYYLVSQETAGGDQWYDNDTVVVTASVASVTAPAYGTPYALAGAAGHSYVPVDLKYNVSVSVTVAPTTTTLFDGQTQQFTPTVSGSANQSVTWTLSPNVGTISSGGLYTAPSPITTAQSITVTGTSVADVTKSGTATINLSPPAPPVITQQPANAAAVLGQTGSFSAAASGVGLTYQWQGMAPGAGSFTNIAGALSSTYTTPTVGLGDSGTQVRVVVTNAQGSVTSSAAILSVLQPGTPYITSLTLGNQRNDLTGWVGMQITVGPAPLTVSSLGRLIAPGNNHHHAIMIVDAVTNLSLGQSTMNTVGGTVGTFVYADLPTPVTLNANASYYILSAEEDQVDQWYNNNTVAVTTTDATIVGASYGTAAPFITYPNVGHTYAPANFKYTVSSAVNVTPNAVTLSASQTQQFSSSVTGGVTWSMNPSVGTLSSSGLYTAPASIAASQSVTITGTSILDVTKSATATVTLVPVAITVTPTTATLFATQTQLFTPTVTGATNTAVTWTISPSGTGSISTGGIYTAPATIASSQTVTVTATTVADNTKFATATVTLNPPSPPVITVSPQNVSTFSGQTASFSVTVTGQNLTYQWQSMPVGGSFANIASATSSSYTTPTLGLGDSGTQFRVVVTNPQGTVTSSAATLSVAAAGTPLVTSKTLGTPRNNYAGWVGMQITVGGSPMTVSALGRIVGPSNTATHTVKIVDATNSNDVASTTVTTAGGTPGTFAYASLASPVTLNANASYYIVSQETQGGDQWYDLDSTVQTTTAAAVTAPIYGAPFAVAGPAGHSYVPVDLKYNVSVSVSVSPTTASLFDGQTKQFTATVNGTGNPSVTWTLSPNVGTISSGGLYTAPTPITSSQSVTVTATSVADASKTATATVTLNPPAPPVITQQPQNGAAIAGQTASFSVTASGLNLTYQWQIEAPGAGSFSNIGGALASAYTTPTLSLADSGTQFRVVVTNSQGSVTSSPAMLAVLTPGTPFISSTVLGPLRNDYSGFVGMKVTVGSTALVVSSLGRIVAPGNSAAHTVKIVDAVTGNDLGTVSVATSGGTVGTFAYTNLSAPVSLNANASYYILSQETQGGDQWYDNLTTAQTTADGALVASVYGGSSPFTPLPMAGRLYVPVNFKYALSASVIVNPTAATLSASQTQQFSATINGGSSSVTWSISPNVGSISTSGLYTAPASIATGQSVTVTATSVADNTKTASATITLTPVSVSVAPGTITLFGAQTQLFTPTVLGTGNTAVTWTISPSGTGSITTGGLYTAPATISATQTVTVTATSAADNTKFGTATVTLSPITVTVAPTTASLFASQTQLFTQTVLGTSNSSVTWTISPAGTGSISTGGLYTAPASIVSAQTVTVTATSAADNTKFGTATVTLNPPAPPTITQQPQAASAPSGQTATFTVTASGLNLTYQWQLMATGAGTFTNIGGATSSSYTTPATAGSDNGTQFRCVVANPQGSATSNPATLTVVASGVSLITSETPGTPRNNYSGWVGMTVTVGASPMTVSSIGRFTGLHNSQAHTLKIVDASNSSDLATVSVSTSGVTPGTIVYGILSSPVTLAASHTYYVVSQETGGADDWYDADSLVQTTSAASDIGPVYGLPYVPTVQAGHTYVILDLKYSIPVSVSVTPTSASLFGGQTQQFTGTVTGTVGNTSVTWALNPNVGSISTAGLYTAPATIASTQSVTVTATSVADGTKSASATITLNPPAPPAITQQPQSATTLVGQAATFSVTASGMGLTYQWQSMPTGGSFANIAGATSSSYTTPLAALADNGTQFRCVVTNGQGSATSNAATLTVSNGTTFVTSTTVGRLRSDFAGWLGAKVTVGSTAMVVGSLGRLVAPGNTGAHIVKIVNATTGLDIASVSIATVGGTSGTYAYAALSSPVTLSANTSYDILSQEGQNSDGWYDNDTTLTTTVDGAISGSVYGTTSPYTALSTPGRSYVPLDFKYALLGQ